jgi:hypothetical protein
MAPDTGYIGIQSYVEHEDLVYYPHATPKEELPPGLEEEFPGFILRHLPDVQSVAHGLSVGLTPPFPTSHYQGTVLQLRMSCPESAGVNTLRLRPYRDNFPIGTGFKLAAPDFRNLGSNEDVITINCVAVLPTPTPGPPTPASVGGVSFAPPGDGGANGSAIDTAALLVLTTGVFALTAAAWYARRRVHR